MPTISDGRWTASGESLWNLSHAKTVSRTKKAAPTATTVTLSHPDARGRTELAPSSARRMTLARTPMPTATSTEHARSSGAESASMVLTEK